MPVEGSTFRSKAEGVWLAQSVEHANLNPGVVSSSPMLNAERTLKIFFKFFLKKE